MVLKKPTLKWISGIAWPVTHTVTHTVIGRSPLAVFWPIQRLSGESTGSTAAAAIMVLSNARSCKRCYSSHRNARRFMEPIQRLISSFESVRFQLQRKIFISKFAAQVTFSEPGDVAALPKVASVH